MIGIKRIFAIACAAAAAHAFATTTVCVTNVADFQSALNDATGRTDTTLIKVARGTYDATAASANGLILYSTAADQGQIDVTGGYNGDCSAQIKNPALTVLDGAGVTGVLRLLSVGGLSVRYLTIQNGYLSINASSDNAGLFVESGDGSVIVDYNIIRNNAGVNQPGLEAIVIDSGATSALHVDGNLIVGNNASNQSGAGFIVNEGTGGAYITNNTIVNNVSQRTDASAVGGFSMQDGLGSITLSNNIFFGNTTADLYIYTSALFIDNDYATLSSGTLATGSAGNVDVDPQFVGATNFHLQASSPLLGAGSLTPPGNLPTIDIEGHPRSFDNLVDMGAYERGDEIYGGSFDD